MTTSLETMGVFYLNSILRKQTYSYVLIFERRELVCILPNTEENAWYFLGSLKQIASAAFPLWIQNRR